MCARYVIESTLLFSNYLDVHFSCLLKIVWEGMIKKNWDFKKNHFFTFVQTISVSKNAANTPFPSWELPLASLTHTSLLQPLLRWLTAISH